MRKKESPIVFRSKKEYEQVEEDSENAASTNWMQILTYGRVIDDQQEEDYRGPRQRLLLMSVIGLILFGLLGARLFMMQVVSAEDYAELANGNRIREVVSYAPRGKILDRNGNVLADNTLVFQISALPYLVSKDEPERLEDFKTIADIVDMKPGEIQKAVLKEGDDYVLPLVVAENLTHEQALRLESVMPELNGFTIEEVPIRSYNADAGLALIIGYSGRVSEADLDAEGNDDLLPTDFIGKAGVEKSFDDQLRGENGWQRIEVDALGRPVRVLGKKEAKPGEDINLSIDLELQKSLASAIEGQMQKANTSRASGVAIHPDTGEVLAMVSVPYYDNNLFADGIEEDEFAKLVNDERQPLYNKVIAGGYTSGSVIKPMVAAAALNEGVVNEKTIIEDKGQIAVTSENNPGAAFIFRGWRPEGLGPMDVRRAIAWSSNIYFYTVGGGHGGIEGLGEERLTRYYREFGLGEKSGINLPEEIDGRVPDNEWKLENKGEPWYVGDSYNISIGQGDLLISPLQLTMGDATIVNDGYVLEPQLIKDAERVVRRESSVDKKYLQIVREGMRQVLLDGTTCECTFSGVPVNVAGKSGTAETNTPGGRRPHAWFTAFAPYENPEIMVTVMIEEGVGGSAFAAPAIAKAMETYFK